MKKCLKAPLTALIFYLTIPSIVLLFAVSACTKPVVIDPSMIDTPEKALRVTIAEWDAFVKTAESLKSVGIITVGTDRHRKVKAILDDGQTALEAGLEAVKMKDMLDAESKEALLRKALVKLRDELAQRSEP